MRLKSWESPRSGPQRNSKSRQASARIRQIKKRNQQLRQKLKANVLKENQPKANEPKANPQNLSGYPPTPAPQPGSFFGPAAAQRYASMGLGQDFPTFARLLLLDCLVA